MRYYKLRRCILFFFTRNSHFFSPAGGCSDTSVTSSFQNIRAATPTNDDNYAPLPADFPSISVNEDSGGRSSHVHM